MNLSNCCKAPIESKHGCDSDYRYKGKCTCEIVTAWYECTKCNKPCDPHGVCKGIDLLKCDPCNKEKMPEVIRKTNEDQRKVMEEAERIKINEEWIKKYFEANMLDGNDVEDCGSAMLSAESVLGFLIEFSQEKDQQHLKAMKEVIEGVPEATCLDDERFCSKDYCTGCELEKYKQTQLDKLNQ